MKLRLTGLLATAVLIAGCGAAVSPLPASSTEPATVSPSGAVASGTASASAVAITATNPQDIYAELAKLAPAQRDPYILQQALQEGSVSWYSVSDSSVLEARAAAFSKMYPGITVHYITLSDADISARPLLEANAGKYLVDILSASAEQANALHAAGLIADQSNITVPDGYPPTAVGKWWVLSGFNPGLIAWNTDLVPASQAPTDWQSLLDPMWKGKVAIDSANVDLIEGLVSKFGAAGARTYVTNLVVNNAALIRSGDTNMLNLMVAGEFPIVAGALGTHVDSLLAKGAHIAWVAPDPSPGTVTVDMIAAHATHPYAAALFLSWLYSVPGATLDASIGRLPLNPNAKIADPNMAQFLVAGSVPNTRLFLLNPDSVGALQGPANSIIDQIITPRYVP